MVVVVGFRVVVMVVEVVLDGEVVTGFGVEGVVVVDVVVGFTEPLLFCGAWVEDGVWDPGVETVITSLMLLDLHAPSTLLFMPLAFPVDVAVKNSTYPVKLISNLKMLNTS